MAYSGTFYRGIDYSPTWVSWSQGSPNTQPFDSDFANDAFASLWAGSYQAAPGPYPNGLPNPLPASLSAPVDNTSTSGYRNDLQTIVSDGFNLVRLYNWDMARGTPDTATPGFNAVGLDHLNFLNTANTLGLKVVVPVSDYFLNDSADTWNNKQMPTDGNYRFSSAPPKIQADFQQFVASITDPTTGKIHAAVHSIDVGNEGDNGQGISYTGTTASNFLYRTNWWIYNLNKQINGTTGTGPDGNPVVNNPTTVLLTATFSNDDQGGNQGSWFNDLVNGVTANQQTPFASGLGTTFATAVTGLSSADPNFANYYYNSFNIEQVAMSGANYLNNGIAATLALYDTFNASASPVPWPAAQFTVPVMLMEVFTPNRIPDGGSGQFVLSTDQATAAVNQAKAIENYLTTHAGATNLMGYNYFEFNDEPSQPKYNGLYQLPATDAAANAQTGTTSTWYGGFGNFNFPVDPLTATPGPTGSPAGTTLVSAWTGSFGATHQGTASIDKLVGSDAADRLRGLAGSDTIDGGKGYDIALFDQNARGYTLKATAGSATITVQDKVGTEGTDTLTGVEQIRFADGRIDPSWIMKTAGLAPAQVLKVVDLYTAGLNRAPDALGLDYYASKLADGVSIGDIAKAIYSSAEAAPVYSAANANPVFVTLAYQNALGRTPDTASLDYWTKELDTGHLARTDFVTALIAGATGADKQYIANKEAVGAHFALTQGLTNVSWARTVESVVNGTAASVTAANAQTDAFAATAATSAGSELVVQIVGLAP